MEKIDLKSRRHFFKLTGIALIGYGLLSRLPFKFVKNSQPKKLKKVKINSFAVKRK